MMQIPIANYMLQIFLGLILSCVLRLHVNNNLRGNEWLLHRFLTLPLLLPTSLALIGIKTGTTFHLSSVISIIPALVISIYIFSKVFKELLYSFTSVVHTIRKVKFLPKNLISTKPQHFHELLSQFFFFLHFFS